MARDYEHTYLLTWNPNKWPWEDLEEAVQTIEEDGQFEEAWSTGNNKSVEPGSRLFLLRQGVEPRGIIGSGIALSETYSDRHWDTERADRGDKAIYVRVSFDVLLNPEMGDDILPLARLQDGELAKVYWSTQTSGIEIRFGVDELERLWADHLRHARRAARGTLSQKATERPDAHI
jgi:5-methylcytosine-specific restriction protein A